MNGLLLAIAFVLVAGGSAYSDDASADLRERLLAGWRRLETVGLRIEAEYREYEHLPGGKERATLEGRFVIDGKSGYLTTTLLSDEGATSQASLSKIEGRTSDYVYGLRRKSANDPYALTYYRPLAGIDSVAETARQDVLAHHAHFAWSIELHRLSLLDADDFLVAKAIRSDPSEAGIAVLETSLLKYRNRGTKAELHQRVSSRIVLDESRWWAIRSFDSDVINTYAGNAKKIRVNGRIEYRDVAPSEAPAPSNYVLQAFEENGTWRGTNRIEFLSWKYRDSINPKELGLAAFGLPEPLQESSTRRTVPTYLWLIGAAILSAVVAGALRRASKRPSGSY